MLQNACLLTKICADTAEKERNFAQRFAKCWQLPYGPPSTLCPLVLEAASACWRAAYVRLAGHELPAPGGQRLPLRGPHRGAVGPAGCTLRPQACRTPRAFNLRELKVPKWLFWQSSRQFVLRETSKVPRVHQILLISDKVWQLRHISVILYVWYLLEVE